MESAENRFFVTGTAQPPRFLSVSGVPCRMPSSRSGWCTAKSTTMPRLTKFSNKNCLARAMFSSRENSFCKAMSKLYASWAFFPRSAFSTAFHRVWRSAYSGGAWDGRSDSGLPCASFRLRDAQMQSCHRLSTPSPFLIFGIKKDRQLFASCDQRAV